MTNSVLHRRSMPVTQTCPTLTCGQRHDEHRRNDDIFRAGNRRKSHRGRGYSGMDGRTTIFDYWSLEKVRRLYNRGACDGRLSDDEQVLLEQYRSVLSLVNSEDAIRDGAFFDLMYVNYNNPGFNPHRQYAYLRSGTDATILIVVNFF